MYLKFGTVYSSVNRWLSADHIEGYKIYGKSYGVKSSQQADFIYTSYSTRIYKSRETYMVI